MIIGTVAINVNKRYAIIRMNKLYASGEGGLLYIDYEESVVLGRKITRG